MRKIISILLSFLLLASSSGIAYSQHFCGGYEMMSEITLGEKKLSCGMNAKITVCGETTIVLEDHDCCKNHVTKISTDDNFAKARFNIVLNKDFVTAFIAVFVLQQLPDYKNNVHFYAYYNPPFIDKDIPVLYQTFLI